MIGKMDRKIKVQFPTYIQDSGGGIVVDDVTEWEQMAYIETNPGNRTAGFGSNDSEAVNLWTYDIRVMMRKINVIKSNYTLEYLGEKYAINTIKVTNERKKQFYELLATKVDGNI